MLKLLSYIYIKLSHSYLTPRTNSYPCMYKCLNELAFQQLVFFVHAKQHTHKYSFFGVPFAYASEKYDVRASTRTYIYMRNSRRQ